MRVLSSRSSYTSSGAMCRTIPELNTFSDAELGRGVIVLFESRSPIFGGGRRTGGAIWRTVFALPGSPDFGGELLPYCRLLRGARAGILDGDLVVAVLCATDGRATLRGKVLLLIADGVFERGGRPPWIEPVLLVIETDCDFLCAGAGFAGIDGVLLLGGGAFAEAFSSSSIYRTPWTRNGRPYSFSH